MVRKMGDDILCYMKRISLFVILAQTLLHFCPQANYEKYLRFFVNLMIVTFLFVPILGVIRGQGESFVIQELNQYETQIQQLDKIQQRETDSLETMYLSTMTNEIKERLNKTDIDTGYFVKNVEIAGNMGEYREIGGEKGNPAKALKILVEEGKKGLSTESVDKIKCKVKPENKEEKGTGEVEKGEIVLKLQKLYAEELGMQPEDVEVALCEMEAGLDSR